MNTHNSTSQLPTFQLPNLPMTPSRFFMMFPNTCACAAGVTCVLLFYHFAHTVGDTSHIKASATELTFTVERAVEWAEHPVRDIGSPAPSIQPCTNLSDVRRIRQELLIERLFRLTLQEPPFTNQNSERDWGEEYHTAIEITDVLISALEFDPECGPACQSMMKVLDAHRAKLADIISDNPLSTMMEAGVYLLIIIGITVTLPGIAIAAEWMKKRRTGVPDANHIDAAPRLVARHPTLAYHEVRVDIDDEAAAAA